MTNAEALSLAQGDEVTVAWPGSNSGADRKLARVMRTKPDGRVGVQVARTTPKGEYTGAFGRELRWFHAHEIERCVP